MAPICPIQMIQYFKPTNFAMYTAPVSYQRRNIQKKI